MTPISGPEVLTKWFGESEETLRNIFDAAATEEHGAIIFFDEIDSVASARGSTSHEASRSVVAQLLTLMDGFKPSTNVIVIAATNRPEDIDPALRRPGRFDWEIKFSEPEEEDREKILRASSRKLATDDNLSHAKVASETRSWSAADLAAIWSQSVGTDGEQVVEVTLTLTYGDGTSSMRTTYFVQEDGTWQHRFGQEEYDLFMPELSYEEFVAAQ